MVTPFGSEAITSNPAIPWNSCHCPVLEAVVSYLRGCDKRRLSMIQRYRVILMVVVLIGLGSAVALADDIPDRKSVV
jgi:hypothetical protein